jgi:uncharacterized protein (TIGR03118 family)
MAGIEEPAPLFRKRRHWRIPLVGRTLQLYDRRQGRLTGFLVPLTGEVATFIWATEDGTISAWTGGLTSNPFNAVLAVNNANVPNATLGAVYKGLVTGVNANGVSVNGGTDFVLLFVTNFRAGTVDAYAPAPSSSTTGFYVPVTTDGNFTDADIPPGYAPFGIQNINGDLFVTYAKQNAAKHDDLAGKGNGFVDVFDTDGHLKRRFASRGASASAPAVRARTASPSQSTTSPSPSAIAGDQQNRAFARGSFSLSKRNRRAALAL